MEPRLAEVDAAAIRTLSELTVDVAFLGAIWLDQGLTSPDPAGAGIKRLMLAHARRRILLADSSTFGRVSSPSEATSDSIRGDYRVLIKPPH